MSKAKKNAERENRIEMEIIVDAFGPEEQAMGWYYYLEEKLHYYGVIQAPMLVNFGYDYIERYVDKLSEIKPRDIQQAALKYFSDRKYLAMVTVPLSKEAN